MDMENINLGEVVNGKILNDRCECSCEVKCEDKDKEIDIGKMQTAGMDVDVDKVEQSKPGLCDNDGCECEVSEGTKVPYALPSFKIAGKCSDCKCEGGKEQNAGE